MQVLLPAPSTHWIYRQALSHGLVTESESFYFEIFLSWPFVSMGSPSGCQFITDTAWHLQSVLYTLRL